MSDRPSILIGALIGLAIGAMLSVAAQEGALDNTWIGRMWRAIRRLLTTDRKETT